MPDTHRVILASGAFSDLGAITHYIRQDSPQHAASMAEILLEAIDSLAFMPKRYRLVGKSRKRGSPIHAMLVRPFIIYYRIEESLGVVYILKIKHSKQRQPRQFE